MYRDAYDYPCTVSTAKWDFISPVNSSKISHSPDFIIETYTRVNIFHRDTQLTRDIVEFARPLRRTKKSVSSLIRCVNVTVVLGDTDDANRIYGTVVLLTRKGERRNLF